MTPLNDFPITLPKKNSRGSMAIPSPRTPHPLDDRIPNLRKIEAALVERGIYSYSRHLDEHEAAGRLALNVWSGCSKNVYLAADEIAADLGISRHEVTAVGDHINTLIR
jgi:hypothetical protein